MGSRGARRPRSRGSSDGRLRRKRAGPLKYLLAVGLNLVPGFGVGYLLVGRRKAFLLSLLGWAVAGGITVYGIVGGRLCSGGLECLGWVAPIALGFLLGIVGVNLTGAVHLFVAFIRRAALRGH